MAPVRPLRATGRPLSPLEPVQPAGYPLRSQPAVTGILALQPGVAPRAAHVGSRLCRPAQVDTGGPGDRPLPPPPRGGPFARYLRFNSLPTIRPPRRLVPVAHSRRPPLAALDDVGRPRLAANPPPHLAGRPIPHSRPRVARGPHRDLFPLVRLPRRLHPLR